MYPNRLMPTHTRHDIDGIVHGFFAATAGTDGTWKEAEVVFSCNHSARCVIVLVYRAPSVSDPTRPPARPLSRSPCLATAHVFAH